MNLKTVLINFIFPLSATVIGGLIVYWFTISHGEAEATIHQYPFHIPTVLMANQSPDNMQNIRNFTRKYKGLCLLSVKNSGNKLMNNVRVINDKEAYFEFSSSDEQLHAGKAKSNIDVGDLLPGESLSIYLWVESAKPFDDGRQVVVAYNEGRAEAQLTFEITGSESEFKLSLWAAVCGVTFGLVSSLFAVLTINKIEGRLKNLKEQLFEQSK